MWITITMTAWMRMRLIQKKKIKMKSFDLLNHHNINQCLEYFYNIYISGTVIMTVNFVGIHPPLFFLNLYLTRKASVRKKIYLKHVLTKTRSNNNDLLTNNLRQIKENMPQIRIKQKCHNRLMSEISHTII